MGVGRVFADDEDSEQWHSAFGGGISVAPLSTDHALRLTAVRGSERTRLYLTFGVATGVALYRGPLAN